VIGTRSVAYVLSIEKVYQIELNPLDWNVRGKILWVDLDNCVRCHCMALYGTLLPSKLETSVGYAMERVELIHR
jgi:hypothetical protein